MTFDGRCKLARPVASAPRSRALQRKRIQKLRHFACLNHVILGERQGNALWIEAGRRAGR